ncbi:MAG TPA: PQQ-dependent sugar dehydrogenase [Acidimicrobiales bacterium]|nr:PQQ-dependent sugar dehydrogenase [Acidimicrobiales bacterium]
MKRLLLVAGLLAAGACGDDHEPERDATATTTTGLGAVTPTSRPDRAQNGDAPVELEVTDVVTGLDTVWSLAFDEAGKLWFTQRNGRLQQVDGPGRAIPGVQEQGEGGLMGLEIDDEGRFYVMFTSSSDNRIVRLDDLQADPEVLVDGIRKAGIHNGGRLRFGPDGTLFAGTGDAGNTSLPPDDDSRNGKVLAIDVDGAGGAGGRPRATVFSTGHRNPQGLCFSADGRFLSTEHGPDRGDEVNVVEQGEDYGWPDSSGTGISNYTPTIAPAGCVVYEADAIPQWKGSLLFTTLKGNDLRRLTFAADGTVADEEVLYDGEFGRLRDVAVGPDGAVYLATSNKDTRGNPRSGDDRIVRIGPATP